MAFYMKSKNRQGVIMGSLARIFDRRETVPNLTIVSENLTNGEIDMEYEIKAIETNDKELKDFLFSLGCYEGETITLISALAENYVVSIKDARYSIDDELARSILI